MEIGGMTIEELNDKIKALIAERDNFAANSNKMIGEYNGRIQAYLEWLETLTPKPPVDTPPPDPPKESA